ncbi:MAG: ArsR family transcriptional regulator [Sphingomonadales bacterium]|nr:MAG: ArsR family transcriptional regulator [Sphingomonadales bacterium]
MSLSVLLRERWRFVALRLLSDLPGYRLSLQLVHLGLCDFGVAITLDQAREVALWLDREGLATFDDGAVPALKLTAKGLRVAQGLEFAAGVARPEP